MTREIVTKRDEIARELAKEFPPKTWIEFGYVYTDTEIWQALLDARTRLAEQQDKETHRLRAYAEEVNGLITRAEKAETRLAKVLESVKHGKRLQVCKTCEILAEIDALADPAPRKEPRNE